MTNWFNWILSFCLISSVQFLCAENTTTVTIYNSNLGLIQEQQTLHLKSGRQDVNITDVAAQIDPATVHLNAGKSLPFHLLEQNFQYDLVNSSKVFDTYLGSKIQLMTKGNEQVKGELLSRDGSILMLQNADGTLRLINSGEIQEYQFPKLPRGLKIHPTLQWVIDADKSGEYPVELSYLTGGMSWKAEYILRMDTTDQNGMLSSWITLTNNSGATFDDAKVKLVAGNIHRAESNNHPGFQSMAAMAKAPPVQERGIFEYHLYDIQFPTTLYQNSVKQVALREPTRVNYHKEYTFEHSDRQSTKQENVDVQIVLENTRENNLGIPLPGGTVRMMQVDTDEKEVLVGEDMLNHTPRDETIRLTAGQAFDVVGDRTITDYQKKSNDYSQISVSISLRNHKKSPVTIQVLEHYYGDWEVQKSSQNYTTPNAGTLRFDVNVPKEGESRVQYTVERHY